MDAAQLTVNIVLVVALIVAAWRVSSAATRVQVANEALEKRMAAATAALEQVPLMTQRLGHIESEQSTVRKKVFSEFPDMKSRVAVLEEKAHSTDRFRAMRSSRPDTTED